MGFLSNILSATVKTVVSPIAVVKDVVKGEPFETTEEVLGSAVEDLDESIEDLLDGDLF